MQHSGSRTREFLGEVSRESGGGETVVGVVSGSFNESMCLKIDTGAGVTVVQPTADEWSTSFE